MSNKRSNKKAEKNRRRRDLVAPTRTRDKNTSGWLVGSFVLLVTVVALYAVGSTAKKAVVEMADRPIAAIEIKGKMQHVGNAEREALVKPLINRRFLAVDLEAEKQRLQQHPWVAQATLSRRWPDRLHIELTEETAIARWRDVGFLNQAGVEIQLGDNQVLAHLPKLSGPSDSQSEVAKQFVAISNKLQPLNLSVKELRLSDDLAWSVELNNGLLVKLGRDELLAKIERFTAVYGETLQPRLAEIETIDLRYRNGLAVKWQKQEISAAN